MPLFAPAFRRVSLYLFSLFFCVAPQDGAAAANASPQKRSARKSATASWPRADRPRRSGSVRSSRRCAASTSASSPITPAWTSQGKSTIELAGARPRRASCRDLQPRAWLGRSDRRKRFVHEGSYHRFAESYSLYGETLRPTDEMLKGMDTLVFDIQDAGVRFYTYTVTMAYCMEEAAKRNIAFYVLDRPNPIGGEIVEGPLLDADKTNFVGYYPDSGPLRPDHRRTRAVFQFRKSHQCRSARHRHEELAPQLFFPEHRHPLDSAFAESAHHEGLDLLSGTGNSAECGSFRRVAAPKRRSKNLARRGWTATKWRLR